MVTDLWGIVRRPVNGANPEEHIYAQQVRRRQAILLADFLKAQMLGFSEASTLDTLTS